MASYTANKNLQQYRTPKRCAIAVPKIYPYKFASTVKKPARRPGEVGTNPQPTARQSGNTSGITIISVWVMMFFMVSSSFGFCVLFLASVSLWDLFDTAYFQMKCIVPRLQLRAYLLSRFLPWHSRKSLPLLHAHFSVLVSGDIREAG